MSVTFSVIIPTAGRESIRRALDSIVDAGGTADDEVVIGTDGPVALAPVRAGQVPVRIVEAPYTGDWGATPRNAAMRAATKSHFVYLDDDNVLAFGALEKLREIISRAPDEPYIFRVDHWAHGILWADPTLRFGNVDGHGFVIPASAPWAPWVGTASADFDHITATISEWGRGLVWHDEVVAVLRPGGPASHRALILAPAEDPELLRSIYNRVATEMANPGGISRERQEQWWSVVDHRRVRPFVAQRADTPVGYGLILEQGGLSWISGAILPSCQRMGLGQQLFGRLMSLAAGQPYLRVRKDNLVARAIYSKLGFTEVETTTSEEIVMSAEPVAPEPIEAAPRRHVFCAATNRVMWEEDAIKVGDLYYDPEYAPAQAAPDINPVPPVEPQPEPDKEAAGDEPQPGEPALDAEEDAASVSALAAVLDEIGAATETKQRKQK